MEEAININISFIFIIIALFVALMGFKIVPQQQVWIIERFGRYHTSLKAGLSFIIPFVDRVAYKHTLKERAISVTEQTAITKDNVTLLVDGMIYVKIVNAVDSSYGVENPYYAVTQLAQTSVRSAIGKLTMDTTFEERDLLNTQIVSIINEAAKTWGIQCMRYEVRDIKPPASVLRAMEMQVAAERQKRAEILESEGKKQSMVNIAEAKKVEKVLGSEAVMTEKINQAKGESEAVVNLANANATAIERIAKAIETQGGNQAVNMRLAENYIKAFSQMAKQNNTMIVPNNSADVASFVAQATTIMTQIQKGGVSRQQKAALDLNKCVGNINGVQRDDLSNKSSDLCKNSSTVSKVNYSLEDEKDEYSSVGEKERNSLNNSRLPEAGVE